MSVKVKSVTKLFGTQKAVDQLSFEARPAEVLGFLGPNGAGKTTTMKILSCYLQPNEGTAEVMGYDVLEQPMEVRKRLGYLPENNPLYLDMYIKEYLSFVSRLHEIKDPRSRIEELIDMTGLRLESKKKIGELSKGYRQRVGLAQALIHDPDVLILDEPTSGLDPNQLAEIRALIKELGKSKTVIFSTHIMQEVQPICDRVIIINRGKMIANEEIENLGNFLTSDQMVEVEFSRMPNLNTLKSLPFVKNVKRIDDRKYLFYADPKNDIRELIFEYASSASLPILEMYKKESSVEDVFQSLTKSSSTSG